MTGFEPATFRPPDGCATGLRYIPNFGGANLRKIAKKRSADLRKIRFNEGIVISYPE